jgi:hypothetical protein
MKRFALFHIGKYPLGGMDDFVMSFDSEDDAIDFLENNSDLGTEGAVIEDMAQYLED